MVPTAYLSLYVQAERNEVKLRGTLIGRLRVVPP